MKDKIIRLTIEHLKKKEGLRFSVDTLASELKVSKKTIYKFFSTKEALAVAVHEKFYSEALGKIGGAFFGGKLTKADPHVTKYLGLTLLPHSGVSLIFTGIAVNTITGIDPSLAAIISGTIVSAAIINEIIAVLLAKAAFRRAGEIDPQQTQKPHPTA